jgi:anthranilate/para-aminobenzoate synthase component II
MKHKDLTIYGIQFHPCYDEDAKKIKELGITDENYGEHEGPKLINNFISLICEI